MSDDKINENLHGALPEPGTHLTDAAAAAGDEAVQTVASDPQPRTDPDRP